MFRVTDGAASVTDVIIIYSRHALTYLFSAICTSQAQSAQQEPAPSAAAPAVPKLAPPTTSASAAGMPPGWGQANDPSSGRTYYFNSVTGAQSHSMPRTAYSPDPHLSPKFVKFVFVVHMLAAPSPVQSSLEQRWGTADMKREYPADPPGLENPSS